jgi:hypothetical protein
LRIFLAFVSYPSIVLYDRVVGVADDGSASQTDDGIDQTYFAKYLTSSKLLSLQMSDRHFKRTILMQACDAHVVSFTFKTTDFVAAVKWYFSLIASPISFFMFSFSQMLILCQHLRTSKKPGQVLTKDEEQYVKTVCWGHAATGHMRLYWRAEACFLRAVGKHDAC